MTAIRPFSALAAFLLTAVSLTAQWQPYLANTSGVQAVRSITTQGGAIYLASFPLGVYKSTNDGASWATVNSGLPVASGNINIESVGSNATHLFAGTHSGVYRSSNGGTTWTLANGTLTANANVFANKFFNFGGVTFVVMSGMISSGGGVYRTNNNGDTWSVSHAGMGSNMTVYHIASINNVFYAATSAGMVRSLDNGVNWSTVSGSNFAMYSVQGTPSRLVCISDAGYKFSTNGGASWNNATGAIAVPLAKSQLILYDGKYFAITGASQGMLRSLDQGSTWSAFNTGLAAFDQVGLEEFHASGTKLYVGAIFDIYSINGTTTGVEQAEASTLPVPYPTVFTDGFQIDLSSFKAGSTLLFVDATGREVAQRSGLPGALVRVDRAGLAQGSYRLVLVNAADGRRVALGTVIAE
jgi:photosystem II stability/assembly factor-like uncharacterized protein